MVMGFIHGVLSPITLIWGSSEGLNLTLSLVERIFKGSNEVEAGNLIRDRKSLALARMQEERQWGMDLDVIRGLCMVYFTS